MLMKAASTLVFFSTDILKDWDMLYDSIEEELSWFIISFIY